MLIQIFGVTNKEHYGMLWYFWEWSIYFKKYHDSIEVIVIPTSHVIYNKNHRYKQYSFRKYLTVICNTNRDFEPGN